MADRKRLVTLDSSGSATLVLDLETSTYSTVRGSVVWESPAPNAIVAKRERRFGGSETVAEHHDNGSVAWKMLVAGTSTDTLLLATQTLLKVLQAPRRDLYFEWRADGATTSVFYDIGGTIAYTPTYEWAQASQAHSVYIDIKIPLKPLALLAAQTFTTSSTAPMVMSITGIGGDAPAIANVTTSHSSGSAPIWMMYGWSQHPTTPLSGAVAPFGLIQAESNAAVATWANVSDANYFGGAGVRATTSGAGSAAAAFTIDPSTLIADDFSAGEIDIEVWARVEVASTLVSPTLAVGMFPLTGLSFGAVQWATPYGTAGHQLTVPSSSTAFRFVRLGVLTMPVDPVTPIAWTLQPTATWAAGSSGIYGLDYLVCVPAKGRACSKSGVPNDSFYPDFITSTSATTKTIMGADLSGRTASSTGNAGRDSGLGGSPIELPPGDVDLMIKPSTLVPDDPTSDTTSERISDTFAMSVTVFPRVFWAKGQ